MSYHDLTDDQRQFLYTNLTEQQHAVVRARIDGHSFRTIAKAMRLDESTIRGHMERAEKRLEDAAQKEPA